MRILGLVYGVTVLISASLASGRSLLQSRSQDSALSGLNSIFHTRSAVNRVAPFLSTRTFHITIPSKKKFEAKITTSSVNGQAIRIARRDVESENGTTLSTSPQITPALAVAGVALILSGLTLAFMGVKDPRVQVSLSTAYLAGTVITILVLFLMTPPVSNAIQGAYLVAILMGSLIAGGIAVVFEKRLHGVSAAIGGFSLAMFILVMHDGGMIISVVSKAVFIAGLTAGFYALQFNQYIHRYIIIGSNALAGSTGVVLGVDCFSCVGLKEFWIYIWNLSSKTSPGSQSTYPVSHYMTAEISTIAALSILGVLSQIRIWDILKKHKESFDHAKRREIHKKDDLEAELGRILEETKSRQESSISSTISSKTSSLDAATTVKQAGHVGDQEQANGDLIETTSIITEPHPCYLAITKSISFSTESSTVDGRSRSTSNSRSSEEGNLVARIDKPTNSLPVGIPDFESDSAFPSLNQRFGNSSGPTPSSMVSRNRHLSYPLIDGVNTRGHSISLHSSGMRHSSSRKSFPRHKEIGRSTPRQFHSTSEIHRLSVLNSPIDENSIASFSAAPRARTMAEARRAFYQDRSRASHFRDTSVFQGQQQHRSNPGLYTTNHGETQVKTNDVPLSRRNEHAQSFHGSSIYPWQSMGPGRAPSSTQGIRPVPQSRHTIPTPARVDPDSYSIPEHTLQRASLLAEWRRSNPIPVRISNITPPPSQLHI